jgi:isopropylmalate/homocitrate/citramalate synthase
VEGVFDYGADRIRTSVNGMGEQNLSCEGREVMLKLVAQATPTYTMRRFKLNFKLYQGGKFDR